MTISAAERLAPRPAWLMPLAALAALLLVAGCSEAPPRVHALGGQTMGTAWVVQVAELPAGVSRDGLQTEIEAALELVNGQMSTYRDDSDITRFNQAAAGETIAVAEDFALVLSAALELAAETEGAYDPTVGPLVNLWGFGPDGWRTEAPPTAEIEAARARVGWQQVDFDARRGKLTQPGGVYLDFSSIAKGHAVDGIAERLEAVGINDYLVDIGGDLRVNGRKPDGTAWRIAIERPTPGTREIHRVLEPQDLAVATSGVYRNFFADEERAYSHTIDPRTGFPVANEVASITVLHGSAKQADALATAFGVLGVDAGYEFASQRNLAVLFLFEDKDGTLAERATAEFDRLTREGRR